MLSHGYLRRITDMHENTEQFNLLLHYSWNFFRFFFAFPCSYKFTTMKLCSWQRSQRISVYIYRLYFQEIYVGRLTLLFLICSSWIVEIEQAKHSFYVTLLLLLMWWYNVNLQEDWYASCYGYTIVVIRTPSINKVLFYSSSTSGYWHLVWCVSYVRHR